MQPYKGNTVTRWLTTHKVYSTPGRVRSRNKTKNGMIKKQQQADTVQADRSVLLKPAVLEFYSR